MKTKFLAILLVIPLFLGGGPGAVAKTLGNDTIPQQVFDGMKQSFVPSRAKGVHARYQFDLSGPNGGLWGIEVKDAKCRFGRARLHDPGVTFLATDRDWVALSNGTLSGLWAFVTGRLKIHGDQQLARQLDDLFP